MINFLRKKRSKVCHGKPLEGIGGNLAYRWSNHCRVPFCGLKGIGKKTMEI